MEQPMHRPWGKVQRDPEVRVGPPGGLVNGMDGGGIRPTTGAQVFEGHDAESGASPKHGHARGPVLDRKHPCETEGWPSLPARVTESPRAQVRCGGSLSILR